VRCDRHVPYKTAQYSNRTAAARLATLGSQVKMGNVTVATLLIEAEQARAIAKTAKNASAMVAATTLIRLCGLLIDRIEDMVAREKLAAERESIGRGSQGWSVVGRGRGIAGSSGTSNPGPDRRSTGTAGIHHARSVRALTREQDVGK
jgi:hypothetical protein